MARGRAERERLEAAQRQLEQLPKRARTEAARKARARAQGDAAPKPSELPFMQFVDRIEQADGEAQVRSAALIAAGADSWRANAWLLERLRALVNGDEWAQQPAQTPADRHHLGTREHLAVEAARS